jgi:hypothetical protein
LKQSNPIQQRIELLVEKWEATAAQPGVNIVRIHAQADEKDMVDTFYSYLLGVDTDNHDIPIIFQSIYHEDVQYTKALLDELSEMIEIWNNANRDNLDIETKDLDWKPDYLLKTNGNPAALFVANLNNLALHLDLGKNIFLVAVLKVSFVQPQQFCRWLEYALQAGMNGKFKILIDDSTNHAFYEKLATKYPAQIATVRPDLNMDNAMQQVAAMGNPNDPAVQYRQAFLKMMQAIEKRKENETVKHASACIEIAEKNIAKNPYWIGQVIAVYAALSNDQVGYRNFKKAISYADKGVAAAEQSKEIISDESINRKFRAQAVMMRASLYAADKNWLKAVEDFSTAAAHYIYTSDFILAMESYRMMGFSHQKNGNTDAACKALVKGLEFAAQIPAHIVRYTTFPGILELLLQINNQKYINQADIQQAAETVYGKEWLKEIQNWKHPRYEQVTDPAAVMF